MARRLRTLASSHVALTMLTRAVPGLLPGQQLGEDMRLAGLRRALVALAAMTGLAVRAVELDPRAGVLGPRAPHARRAHPRHAPKVATRPDGLSPTRSERGDRTNPEFSPHPSSFGEGEMS